ncbi:KOW domain-containing RNA-binding protein [Pelotomaculum terephthalicicum JT]|uniref:KOW domain-containing RNA-binding protein n=1 Tax=Pelotomaculum TaxID=191373 RepID=UPI0009D5890B|nr:MULTISPECIES: KOW domain-containing RNA-binding protein [Pelotomaculum]MCG9967870.1 KOW domain-containing RNA-binding protein [Pelotomaculum terephthalicicum JT]OPX90999.1 MAG: hypothetical protein A4E54_00534 [Pelotomaculum sp. PtaB.Bin117]OPY61446.1 MAG: hypothetical protein A4E56_02054 [Pelotomaculum sp. PtaU1.Bin065]
MSQSVPDDNSGNIVFSRKYGDRDALQVGHLVSSTKGRDRGRYYLVIGCESLSRVCVADGEGRKVENPKYKNIKHLHIHEVIAGELSSKAEKGKRITNADIREELKSLVKNFNECSF